MVCPALFLNCHVLSNAHLLYRAIMFHIGVATQHPPLPEPGQLSELGIDFIRQCLTIDPIHRPMATELMDHLWILDCREKLRSYEEAENAASPPNEMPDERTYENATVARQAAILQEKEVETIQQVSPTLSPLETPEGSSGSSGSGSSLGLTEAGHDLATAAS